MENRYEEKFIVEMDDCISTINSTLPAVLGTYTLVKWMEIVSAKLINRHIDCQSYLSVGKIVNIEHSGMVRVNDEVEIISKLEEQSKKEARFLITATANGKEIAKATHIRVILPLKLIDRMLK
jgi:predicted thioesterase